MAKFRKRKTLQDCRTFSSGRKKSVRTDETRFAVLRTIHDNRSASLRKVAKELDISYGSVCRFGIGWMIASIQRENS